MESSLYAFVEDLRGEGPEKVLDRVLGEYGCDGLTVAAAYHRARDVTPHGSSRVTLRRDGVHFIPPADLFDGLRLQPPVQDGAEEEPLRAVRRLTAERGAGLSGWTVFLHNTTLGLAHPETTQENCFGDRAAPADLCPAHPDVRAYATALARAVARTGVDAVVAESLHFGLFGHGYHHERDFVGLGPVEDFLLGLCFCVHCRRRTEAADADAGSARAEAARAVQRVLDGATPLPGPLSPEALAEQVGRSVADYATGRRETVSSLVATVASAVADEGSRLVFIDLTGAAKGYADGLPADGPAVDDAWRCGVDPAAVAASAAGYAVLAYARDPARIAQDLTAYRAAVGDGPALRAVLRPGRPDTSTDTHLAEKLQALATTADAVDFYHYGLYPLPVLTRIGHALAGRSRK
ncbi:hypothetical protein ABT009_05120 [Streptomyces sp. NPDC002896]|uniref:hypothetical protein n=1 Tax=Streptomyces sp. NPDC002896 TaxID=3154438 RepID=UPI003318ECF0